MLVVSLQSVSVLIAHRIDSHENVVSCAVLKRERSAHTDAMPQH